MNSLKTKLILAISVLIFVLFGVASFLFLAEKQRELTQDIFVNGRSFAELTAPEIVANYNLYLPQKSFVYFNREIQSVFEKSQDVAALQVVSYKGELAYDSTTEVEKQYEGPQRLLQDQELLAQVKSRNPSVRTLDTGRTVFLKKTESGDIQFVDADEQPVAPLAADEKIAYLVQPGSDDFAVVYNISYALLQERVNQTMLRGVLLGVFGVGIGIFIAFFFAVGITNPLKNLTAGAGIIAKGNFQHRVEVKTKDELLTLANAFNSMAQELEISTKALVYKERVAKELELAAKIQKELLPKEIPKIEGMDISAGLLPAEEIGGDCYDFIMTDPQNLLMYLGDVTGHGVPSGLVVSVANALIYNYAGKTDMKDLLMNVNRILKEKTASNMFMTLVMLTWSAMEKKLLYCSAGHEQMVHYHAADGKVTLTPAGGLALGMFPTIEKTLEVRDVPMEKGDALIVYSDGIPESWKSETEMYGMGRLKRAVSEYCDLPSAFAIRNALLADVKEFSGKWKQMDDITIMVLKRN
ncbi:MAG TPA: PP2C family protein-serine/threonine phosphatase [Candidatus Gracilibacteria bacterium]|nr:PP2C family protein-serine/threonine phosphatase [Candidatus Gracilibacteria bacterium]